MLPDCQCGIHRSSWEGWNPAVVSCGCGKAQLILIGVYDCLIAIFKLVINYNLKSKFSNAIILLMTVQGPAKSIKIILYSTWWIQKF